MKSTLYIQNLKCKGCEATIIEKLSKLRGITEVLVNQDYDTVNFKYLENGNLELVKKELSKLGYPPYGEKNSLTKKAKSYVSCAIGRTK